MLLNYLIFIVAQLLHVVATAFLASQNVNTRWKSVDQYVNANLGKLITQVVLSSAVFWLLMEDKPVTDSLGTVGQLVNSKGGVILFGWFCDSLLDKVLGYWGLKKEA